MKDQSQTNVVLSMPDVNPLPEFDGRIQTDLVKAERLGLDMKQAACLGAIQRIIHLEAVPYSDIDEDRWWHISPEYLNHCPGGKMYAPTIWHAEQHLIALERASLITSIELDHSPIVRNVYRLRTDVVIWRESSL